MARVREHGGTPNILVSSNNLLGLSFLLLHTRSCLYTRPGEHQDVNECKF